LTHVAGHAICVKATSKIEVYINDPERMAGCILYRAGELSFFTRDTVIEPDNYFAVRHRVLRDPRCVLGRLPESFHARLVEAIGRSIMLSRRQKAEMLRMIGEP
jgi:hypothetical protein